MKKDKVSTKSKPIKLKKLVVVKKDLNIKDKQVKVRKEINKEDFAKKIGIALLVVFIGWGVFSNASSFISITDSFWIVVLKRMLMYGAIPLSALGAYYALDIMGEFIKFSKGHYKVIFRHPNNTITTTFLKPKGKIFEYKGKTFEFKKDPNSVYFGRFLIPTVEYDITTTRQLDFQGKPKDSTLDSENLNALFFRVYNLGKKDALKDMKFLLFLCLVAAIASTIGAAILLSWSQGGLPIPV